MNFPDLTFNAADQAVKISRYIKFSFLANQFIKSLQAQLKT